MPPAMVYQRPRLSSPHREATWDGVLLGLSGRNHKVGKYLRFIADLVAFPVSDHKSRER